MKRWLIIGSILVVLLVIGIILLNYLSTGKVVVVTPETNSEFVISNDEGQEIKRADGEKLSTRLKPGEYSVEATHEHGATRQSFTITARKTTEVSLEVISVKQAVLVANRAAEDIKVDNQQILFRDPAINRLVASTQQGEIIPYLSEAGVVNVEWLDGQRGIIQTLNQNAFVFNNGTLTDVSNLPEVEDPSIVEAVSADAANNQFAYTEQADIYLTQLPGVSRKIHRAETSPSISLAGDKLAVFFPELDGEPEATLTLKPYVLDIGTNETTPFSEEEISSVLWSPDGKRLAYETSSYIGIFELDSKRTIQRLPKETSFNSGTPLLWMNQAQLLYVDSAGLWRLSPQSGQVIKLADLEGLGGSAGLGLTLRADTDEIFFSNGDLANPAIYKVDLNSDYDQTSLRLTESLPHSESDFEISMVYVDTPQLTVTTYAPFLNLSQAEYNQLTQQAKDRALDYLKQNEIDPSNLFVRYLTGNPNYR